MYFVSLAGPYTALQILILWRLALCWLDKRTPSLRFALRRGAVKQDSILVIVIGYMDTDTVTEDPGSKPDQKYARRRDRKSYVWRIK